MDSSDRIDLQMKEQVVAEKAKSVCHSILSEYKAMVDNINDSHFNVLKDVIQSETVKTIEVETAVAVFKKMLWKHIESQFLSDWNEIEIDKSLMQLGASKAIANDQEKKWRPTSVPAEQQVFPSILRELTKQRNWLDRQTKHQDQVIENLVVNVEQLRRQFKDNAAKRDLLIAQMKADRENFKNVEEHIKKINKQLNLS